MEWQEIMLVATEMLNAAKALELVNLFYSTCCFYAIELLVVSFFFSYQEQMEKTSGDGIFLPWLEKSLHVLWREESHASCFAMSGLAGKLHEDHGYTGSVFA